MVFCECVLSFAFCQSLDTSRFDWPHSYPNHCLDTDLCLYSWQQDVWWHGFDVPSVTQFHASASVALPWTLCHKLVLVCWCRPLDCPKILSILLILVQGCSSLHELTMSSPTFFLDPDTCFDPLALALEALHSAEGWLPTMLSVLKCLSNILLVPCLYDCRFTEPSVDLMPVWHIVKYDILK